MLAALALALLALPGPPDAAAEPVDTERLPRLLAARGFAPPPGFRGLVGVVAPGPGDGYRVTWFSYADTATDRVGWWPASTVKLFAAVAALEATAAAGLPPSARATFRDDGRDHTYRVDVLVRQALVPSNNLAYDRLVEIVGCEALNTRFLPSRGLGATVLARAYARGTRDAPEGVPTNRASSAVDLAARGRAVSLPPRRFDGPLDCPDEGNCTTLLDLADALRRVMGHELLPPAERFALGPPELRVLRGALGARKPRGNGVVDGLSRGFGRGRLVLHHKPGFAHGWFSDVVHVAHPASGRRWLVALAGSPGRAALDDAARHIGAILRGL